MEGTAGTLKEAKDAPHSSNRPRAKIPRLLIKYWNRSLNVLLTKLVGMGMLKSSEGSTFGLE